MTIPVPERPLFMLDYDGTLAAIVTDPSEAAPHPRVPGLLTALMARYPVYIVTGRKVKDLEPLLPLPGLRVIGIHGMEEGALGSEPRALLAADALAGLAQLRARLPALPGLKVEDKGAAIALHYRNADDEEEVVKALRRWLKALPEGLEALWGKKVLELRPQGYSKAKAAVRLAAEHSDKTPVFLGDDTTDEEAFAALGDVKDSVTIKVGDGASGARYRLAGIDAVIHYLEGYL